MTESATNGRRKQVATGAATAPGIPSHGGNGRFAADGTQQGTAADDERTWLVSNQTARPLHLSGHEGLEWVLPAYGRRILEVDPRSLLELRAEEARGEVTVSGPRRRPGRRSPRILALSVWLFPLAIYAGIAASFRGLLVVATLGLLILLTYALLSGQGDTRARMRSFLAELPAWLLQAGTFVIVLAVGVILPTAAIVFGADLRAEIRHALALDATPTEYLTLVCRAMQIALISIASLLPALLYYQFDRDRLSTLREKFVHQIFRLDASMATTGAIRAKYGLLIDEIYGPERSGRFRKLPPGRRAPILVATLLIMLGWLLVLLNPDVRAITDEAMIAELFQPRQTAPAFAFLGAYFFTLFSLLRGYVRRDLRPKSYSDISVRIITVVILAWVLQLVVPDDSHALLVFAFLTGIVPQTALNLIREYGVGRLAARERGRKPDPTSVLGDLLPLTDLEGIDLYDRTRLGSEGVTNIEGLAHHDLVELMLLTRIPVPRLIDWTDQAILHLHVDADDRALLRRYGIRTASDLLHARDCARRRGDAELCTFLGLLDGVPGGNPRRMPVILDAMEDEEWMQSIRSWNAARGRRANATVSC